MTSGQTTSAHTYFGNSVGSVLQVPEGTIGSEGGSAELNEEGEDEVGEVDKLSEGGGVLEEDEAQPS